MPELDKAEIKKLLIKSKKEPVSCAVGFDKAGNALIELHKTKQPRALMKILEDQYKDLKNPRWGTAFVDVDDDPKLVILTLNKPSSGLARKMKKTLKGTGFAKVRVMLEGGGIDEADEEDEEEAQPQDAPAPTARGADEGADAPSATPAADGGAAPEGDAGPAIAEAAESGAAESGAAGAEAATAAPQEQAPGVDFDGLTKQLTELVKQLVAIAKSDPAKGKELQGLAAQCQAAIKGKDAQAAGLIAQLAQALGAAGAAGQQGGAADPAKKAALEAAPKLWDDTITVVSSGVGKLKDAILKDFADEAPEVLADIQKNLDRIDQVTARFDKTLAELLKGVNAATDEAARQAGLKKARSVLAEHIKYAASEPLIGMIDQNPFGVSPEIKKTLVANLTQLANAIR